MIDPSKAPEASVYRLSLYHCYLGEAIRIADHCYGCTAGQGSSCGGALDDAGQARTEPVHAAA